MLIGRRGQQAEVQLVDVLRAGGKLQSKLHLTDRKGHPIKGARTGDQPTILATVEIFFGEDPSHIVREHTVHEHSTWSPSDV